MGLPDRRGTAVRTPRPAARRRGDADPYLRRTAVTMREAPTWRIPVGVLLLVVALGLYGIVVASFVPPLIGEWNALAQTPVYVVLGVIWRSEEQTCELQSLMRISYAVFCLKN